MQHPGLPALEQELKDCLRIAGQKTYRMGQEHPERDPERVWAWMLENALEDFAYQWPMLLYCRGITEQFSKPHAPCHIHLEINRRWEDPIRQGDYYRVESADTLWGIARRYGITLEELYAVNPGLQAEDARKLAVGRELVLPYGVPFRMRASLELLLPMHQQRMLEAYYHLGFLKKYSGIASLDLAYYREGRSPFGQDRMPLITPGWSYQTVWKQEAHPSQRPWTLAGTQVGLPPAYRFDSEGKGMKIGEPAHSPRLHLAEQNRWAAPPADGPVVAIDWLNLAPERMQDGWKETLAACRISLEAVYDAYEESLPYIKAVGRGIGSALEGMAPIRPVKEGEPSTIPEALESFKDIPKNLVNLPGQLEEVYEKGTAEQQIETTIVVGESLVGLLKGKPPKSKIAAVAAGMGSKGKKVDKLGKVLNAGDEVIKNHISKGVHSADDITTGLSNATDKQKWLDDLADGVYRNGNKAEYVNPSGNVLKWTDQSPKSINQSINSALVSKDPGKLIEGKVASFVKDQGKDVEGFGLKIQNSTTGQTAGDIDILTKNEIIEVKKSASSFKEGQVDKFTDSLLPNFLNPHGRKAILYIDEPLTAIQKANILTKVPDNVTLVNSLGELSKILN